MTPFRSEKNSNWEGAYRVPAMVRWPGHIKAGTVDNDIVSHLGLAAHAPRGGGCSRRERATPERHESRRHDLQGASRRLQPAAAPDRPDHGRSAQGVLLLQRRRRPGRPALRQLEDRLCRTAGHGHDEDLEPNRLLPCGCRRSSICAPTPTNARTSRRTPITTGCSTMRLSSCRRRPVVGKFLATFKEFPPSQKSGSFSIDQVMDKMQGGAR